MKKSLLRNHNSTRLRREIAHLRRENDAAESALAAAPRVHLAEILSLATDPAVNRRAESIAAALAVWRVTLARREQKAVSTVWEALLREVRLAIAAAEAVERRNT